MDKETLEILTGLSPELLPIATEIETICPVDYSFHSDVGLFIQSFRALFIQDLLSYKMKTGKIGASRSSLTYHIAMSMASSAKMIDHDIIFESEGKRDAVIRSKGEKPKDLLFAEWEWDFHDIFGKSKEIEKLNKSLKSSKFSHALLITYVEKSHYLEFLKKVIENWRKLYKKDNSQSLFFFAIIFENETLRIFETIRIVEIWFDEIIFWEDYNF